MSDSASKGAAKASSPRPSSSSCAATSDPDVGRRAAAASARSRLFFALWPAPPLAHELHELARVAADVHGGRVMRRDTLHLTMAFLGDVPNDTIAALCEIGTACAAAAAPFDLVLDQLGYWPRKRIVWVGPSAVPLPLVQLANDLSGRLGEAVHDRRFNPHVTLVRKAGAVPGLPPPMLAWRVDALCLVRSLTESSGARYATVGKWPLGE